MKNKLWIAAAILFLIIIGGYLFIRLNYLKAKDFKPDTSKEKSIIDLRPAIIAKLQQLVKDGSNGLYILSVEKIEPHLLSSKLDVLNASIHIDTAAMRHLDSLQLLPDDIFTFHLSMVHIDGIGIADLLNKDRIEITGIHVSNPVITLYHKKRSYNEIERKNNDTLSLYEKLKGRLKKIAIGKIDVANGTFINHDIGKKNKEKKFKDISILINDLLIDSLSQYDKSRFLFAKHAIFSTKNYSIPTSDGLYFFKAGNISLAGEQHTITALNVELKPRYKREQFENKLPFRNDMFQFNFPKVILNDIDVLAMINDDRFIAKRAEIAGGSFSDFIDRSKPQKPVMLNNFPHQLLMRIPFKLSINRLDVHNVNIAYEEHNPLSEQNGIVYFDNLHGSINHISNIPAEINMHPVTDFSGTALFMHHVPMTAKFKFNLLKYRTGDFSVDITMDTLDNITINKISEPLGLFSVKTGQMQHAQGHIDGNNSGTSGSISMQYNNLHLTPLKKDEQKGKLKKKVLTGFFANILLIKNENPKGKELRQPNFTVERDKETPFFNLIWKTILTGILKTLGIPVKLVIK
ncbi:MAG: hypothetical protein JWO92_1426 [Chitinophagaceae bacterium]|nr:hypothetical protein [Chitinophagaceae bacterium]